MTEKSGALFGKLPVLLVRPERGNFLLDEAGADADGGVMERDRVATDEPEQLSARKRVPKPVGLDGNEQFCVPGNLLQQFREAGICEVMQKKIRNDDFVVTFCRRPVKNIGHDRFGPPAK